MSSAVDSVQESAHERVDRVWRRWAAFCHDELGDINPLLHETLPAEIDLILSFEPSSGNIDELNLISKEVFVNSVRNRWYHRVSEVPLASALAKEFRNRIQQSPLHQQDNKRYIPSLTTSLFQAFDNVSPPENRQKAVTTHLLRSMAKLVNREIMTNVPENHAVDLIVGEFFFATLPRLEEPR